MYRVVKVNKFDLSRLVHHILVKPVSQKIVNPASSTITLYELAQLKLKRNKYKEYKKKKVTKKHTRKFEVLKF